MQEVSVSTKKKKKNKKNPQHTEMCFLEAVQLNILRNWTAREARHQSYECLCVLCVYIDTRRGKRERGKSVFSLYFTPLPTSLLPTRRWLVLFNIRLLFSFQVEMPRSINSTSSHRVSLRCFFFFGRLVRSFLKTAARMMVISRKSLYKILRFKHCRWPFIVKKYM